MIRHVAWLAFGAALSVGRAAHADVPIFDCTNQPYCVAVRSLYDGIGVREAHSLVPGAKASDVWTSPEHSTDRGRMAQDGGVAKVDQVGTPKASHAVSQQQYFTVKMTISPAIAAPVPMTLSLLTSFTAYTADLGTLIHGDVTLQAEDDTGHFPNTGTEAVLNSDGGVEKGIQFTPCDPAGPVAGNGTKGSPFRVACLIKLAPIYPSAFANVAIGELVGELFTTIEDGMSAAHRVCLITIPDGTSLTFVDGTVASPGAFGPVRSDGSPVTVTWGTAHIPIYYQSKMKGCISF